MKAIIALGCALTLCACDAATDYQMGQITDKVATDAEEQYEIAKRSGTPMDICTHAGLVSAAWIQAKNDSKYANAKEIEKADCARAGLPSM